MSVPPIAQWHLREQLAQALIPTLQKLLHTDKLNPRVVATLAYFREFLGRSLGHNKTLKPEREALATLVTLLDELKILARFNNLRAHATTLITSSEDLDLPDPGSIESIQLFLNSASTFKSAPIVEAEHADKHIERLTQLLQFLSFVPIRTSKTADIKAALVENVNTLWRIYHDESGAGGGEIKDTKQLIVGRLLWAQNERDHRRDSESLDLDAWWSLLQSYEELGALTESADAKNIRAEANSLSNILKFARELEFVQRRQRCATDTFTSGSRDSSQTDSIDEMRNYVRELLLDRIETFCGMVPHKLAKDSAGITAADLEGLSAQELAAMDLVLFLRVLLQFQNIYISPGLRRLEECDAVIAEIASSGLTLSRDGLFYPESPTWARYARQCETLDGRLRRYVTAYLTAKDKTRIKPFVVLVVGRPGTGKSQFIHNIVSSAIATAADKPRVTTVDANLSQAVSVPEYLEAVWTTLEKTNNDIALLVLDEFDATVGGRSDQFRYALAPLWDGRTQLATSGRRGDEIEDIRLGAFVAVCVMSKAETLSGARRLLLGVDKGLDFLSRVDAVVEIPYFDGTRTQLQFALVALSRQFGLQDLNGDTITARVGELALSCLASMAAVDNFRTISKAVKTIPYNGTAVSYETLNLHRNIRLEFELLLSEYARIDRTGLQPLLSEQAECAGILLTATTTEAAINVTRTATSIKDYLRASPAVSPGAATTLPIKNDATQLLKPVAGAVPPAASESRTARRRPRGSRP